MTFDELCAHLTNDHGHDVVVAVITVDGSPNIKPDESYLRGFHDGVHGRIDADDLKDADAMVATFGEEAGQ